MTSIAIDPKENAASGATHWGVYDDDPHVDWHFGPFESQAEAEAYAKHRNEGKGLHGNFVAADGGIW